jgi:hypothetical protein
MPTYKTNPHRMRALYHFALRRLGAAYLIGTQPQVDRWLAAVEQTRRRVTVLNETSPLMAGVLSV